MPYDKNGRWYPGQPGANKGGSANSNGQSPDVQKQMISKALDYAAKNPVAQMRPPVEPAAQKSTVSWKHLETMNERSAPAAAPAQTTTPKQAFSGGRSPHAANKPAAQGQFAKGFGRTMDQIGEGLTRFDSALQNAFFKKPIDRLLYGKSVEDMAKEYKQHVASNPENPMPVQDFFKDSSKHLSPGEITTIELNSGAKQSKLPEWGQKASDVAGEVTGFLAGGEAAKGVDLLKAAFKAGTTSTAKGALRATLPATETAVEKAAGRLANAGLFAGAQQTAEGFTDPQQESSNLAVETGKGLHRYAGNQYKMSGYGAKMMGFHSLGDNLVTIGEKQNEGFQSTHETSGGWNDLLDPYFWAGMIGENAPTTLAFLPLGIAGQGIGAAGASAMKLGRFGTAVMEGLGAAAMTAPLEAAMEASGSYEQLYKDGMANGLSQQEAHDQARQAGEKTFWANMALLGVSNAYEFRTLFGGARRAMAGGGTTAGKMATGALVEGGQEMAQQAIQDYSTGKPIDVLSPDYVSQGIFGGLMGAGFGAYGGTDPMQQAQNHIASIETRVVSKLTDEEKDDMDAAMADARAQGIPEEQAKRTVLETIAEHRPEIIHEATQEVAQSEQEKQTAQGQQPAQSTDTADQTMTFPRNNLHVGMEVTTTSQPGRQFTIAGFGVDGSDDIAQLRDKNGNTTNVHIPLINEYQMDQATADAMNGSIGDDAITLDEGKPVDMSGEPDQVWKKMREKLATMGNQTAKSKVKHLETMKDFSSQHGFEFAPRHQELLDMFQAEVSGKKDELASQKTAEQSAKNAVQEVQARIDARDATVKKLAKGYSHIGDFIKSIKHDDKSVTLGEEHHDLRGTQLTGESYLRKMFAQSREETAKAEGRDNYFQPGDRGIYHLGGKPSQVEILENVGHGDVRIKLPDGREMVADGARIQGTSSDVKAPTTAAKSPQDVAQGDTIELRGREGQKFTVTGIKGDYLSLKSEKGGDIPQVHRNAIASVLSGKPESGAVPASEGKKPTRQEQLEEQKAAARKRSEEHDAYMKDLHEKHPDAVSVGYLPGWEFNPNKADYLNRILWKDTPFKATHSDEQRQKAYWSTDFTLKGMVYGYAWRKADGSSGLVESDWRNETSKAAPARKGPDQEQIKGEGGLKAGDVIKTRNGAGLETLEINSVNENGTYNADSYSGISRGKGFSNIPFNQITEVVSRAPELAVGDRITFSNPTKMNDNVTAAILGFSRNKAMVHLKLNGKTAPYGVSVNSIKNVEKQGAESADPSSQVLQRQFYAVSPNAEEIEAIRKAKPENILVSYGTWGDAARTKMSIREFVDKLGYKPTVIADNGAFTNFNKGHDSQLYEVMAFFQNEMGLSPKETWHELQNLLNRDDTMENLPKHPRTELKKLLKQYKDEGVMLDALEYLEDVYNRVQDGEAVESAKDEAKAIFGASATGEQTKIVQKFMSAALKDSKTSKWPDFFNFVEWLGYNKPVIDYVMAPDILTKGQEFTDTVSTREESNLGKGSAKQNVDGEYIQQLANFTYRVLQEGGYSSLPVFQYHSDHKYLDELVKAGADYIAIATDSTFSRTGRKEERAKYVRDIITKYAGAGVKFHLLGTNDKELVDMIGPGLYSADGTTWQKAMYGKQGQEARAEAGAQSITKREQDVANRKTEAEKNPSPAEIPDALKKLAEKAIQAENFYDFKDSLMKRESADGQSVWPALEHKVGKKQITVKMAGKVYSFPYSLGGAGGGGVGLPKGGGSVSDWQDRTNMMPIAQEMGYNDFLNMIAGNPWENLQVKKHGFRDLEDFYKRAIATTDRSFGVELPVGANKPSMQDRMMDDYDQASYEAQKTKPRFKAGEFVVYRGKVYKVGTVHNKGYPGELVTLHTQADVERGARNDEGSIVSWEDIERKVSGFDAQATEAEQYDSEATKQVFHHQFTGSFQATHTFQGKPVEVYDQPNSSRVHWRYDPASTTGAGTTGGIMPKTHPDYEKLKPIKEEAPTNTSIKPIQARKVDELKPGDTGYLGMQEGAVRFVGTSKDSLGTNYNFRSLLHDEGAYGYEVKVHSGNDKIYPLNQDFKLQGDRVENVPYHDVMQQAVDHILDHIPGLREEITKLPKNQAIGLFKKAIDGYATIGDGVFISGRYVGGPDKETKLRVELKHRYLPYQITNFRDLLNVYVHKTEPRAERGVPLFKYDSTVQVGDRTGTFKGAPSDKIGLVDFGGTELEKIPLGNIKSDGQPNVAPTAGEKAPDQEVKQDAANDWKAFKLKHNLPPIFGDPNNLDDEDLDYIVNYADDSWMMGVDEDYKKLYRKYAAKVLKARWEGNANESATNGANDSAGMETGQSANVPTGDAVRDDSATPGRDGASGDATGGTANSQESSAGGTGSAGTGNGVGNDNSAGDGEAGVSLQPSSGNQRPRNSDFVITDELNELGGAKTKFKQNVAAIRLLRQLEREGRNPTADEQRVLARYVGWGGVSEAFDERKIDGKDWGREFAELRGLVDDGTITQREYEEMRASTLNGHYTSQIVVNAMYDALQQLGFKGGRVLEPSMGTGNFFGLMPKSMAANSQRVGVEKDTITGGIAKKLYPNANVNIKGFEKYQSVADGYFDVAIGNVPFGKSGVTDASYGKKITERIHNYFFIKSLDLVRDGGIVMFITSSGTLNAKGSEAIRREMSNRANFLGAIRLPGDAFKANAGTEVTTDIILLQKRAEGEPEAHAAAFLETVKASVNGETFDNNQYFADNPDMILGDYVNDKLYPGRIGVKANGRDLSQELPKAFGKLPADIYTDRVTSPQDFADQQQEVADSTGWQDVDSGAYFMENGKLMQRQGDAAVVSTLTGTDAERVKGMVPMRNVVRKLIRSMMDVNATDEEITGQQKELNRMYDAFVKKHGPLNDPKNKNLMRTDPIGSGVLMSIESYEKEGKTANAEKKGIFNTRTIKPSNPKDTADSAEESLVLSFFSRGKLDFPFMMQLTGKTQNQLISDLGDRIFHNPTSDQWETADEYLSGNVRVKLNDAKQAAEKDPKYERNAKMLETVQPVDLESHEIKVRIGSQWIPVTDYEDYINDTLGTKGKVNVRYDIVSSKWSVRENNKGSWYNGLYDNVRNTQEYGVNGKLTMLEIMQDSLNLTPSTIWVTVRDNHGNEKKEPHREQTAEARNIQMQLQEMFEEWLWSDPTREQRLVNTYNWAFNNTKLREYDGQLVYGKDNDHVQIPGLSEIYKLRPHQKDAVWRVLQGKNTLLAHVVGAGKTLEMVVSAMEMRRLGIANKPMMVVPNLTFNQMYDEIFQAYPGAKVLRLTSEDVPSVRPTRSGKMTDKEYAARQNANRLERARVLSQIATGDYDIILMSHEMFTRLPVSPDRTMEHIRQQVEDVVAAIRGAKEDRDNITVKKLEDAKKKLEEKLKKNLDEDKKDVVIPFEELGIDYLFVDEAHYYKNLSFHTKMQNVAGLSTTSAQRSEDMYLKTQWLAEVRNGGGVVFATGTPISNSMSEMFAMQRYLMGTQIRQMGLAHFDAWAAMFGDTTTDFEMTASGQFKQRTRFARFNNVPELLYQFFSFADVKTADMLDYLPKPKFVERHTVSVEMSKGQRDYLQDLVRRAENMGNVDKSEDNWLLLNTHGRMMACDLRLVGGTEDDPGSKLNALVENVAKIYKDKEIAKDKDGNPVDKHAQIVFLDLGTPKKDDNKDGSGAKAKKKASQQEKSAEERANAVVAQEEKATAQLYQDIKNKLINQGVPANEIAFIHDAKTPDEKIALSKKVNDGRIRVLLGSSKKAGVGLNVQKRLVALHHMDPTWTPAGIEQREGRIIRQNNLNDRVHIYTYVTEGSFDALSWDLLRVKATFIAQMMSGKLDVRSADDVGTQVLGFAHIAGVAMGNTLVKDKLEADKKVMELTSLKTRYQRNRRNAEAMLLRLPDDIKRAEKRISNIESDIKARTDTRGDNFVITLDGKTYDSRADADEALTALMESQYNKMKVDTREDIGSIGGFTIQFVKPDTKKRDSSDKYDLEVFGPSGEQYRVRTNSVSGLENAIYRAEDVANFWREEIVTNKQQIEDSKRILDIKFEHADALQEALHTQVDLERQIEQMNAAHDNAGTSGDDESGGPDDSYKGATVEDKMAYDINAEKSGGIGIVAPGFASRSRTRQSRIPQAPAHIEQQIRDSRTSSQPGLMHRIGVRFQQFKAQLTREFEHLPKEPVYEPLRQKLLQLLGQKDLAKFKTYRINLQGITQKLDRHDFELFERKVLIDDQYEEMQRGGALNFDFTPDELEQYKNELDDAVGRNPRVLEALRKRKQAWDEIKENYFQVMESIGYNVRNKLTREHYFRRLVIQHAEEYERNAVATGKVRKLETPAFSGHLRGRSGSFTGNHITDYLIAEGEVMTQMIYDSAKAQLIQFVDQKYNQMTRVKREAKSANDHLMEAIFNKEKEDPDAEYDRHGDPISPTEKLYKKFGQRIAIGFEGFTKIDPADLWHGTDGEYLDVAIHLTAGAKQDPDDDFAERKSRSYHPDTFPYLTQLVQRGEEGAMEAATILKNVADRKAFIEDTLGTAFVTPERMAKEQGLRIWQPLPGSVFFRKNPQEDMAQVADDMFTLLIKSFGVPQEALDEMISKLNKAVGKDVIAVGARRKEFAIEEPIALTLDNITDDPQYKGINKITRALTLKFKQSVLLAPNTVVKYNLRNTTSDLEKTFAGNPKAMKKIGQAIYDLSQVYYKGAAGSPELRQFMARGGLSNVQQVSEMGDIKHVEHFQRFYEKSGPNAASLLAPVKAWWNLARTATDFREAILRYANYLSYVEQIQSNKGKPDNWGSSRRELVMALEDPRDRAYKMANELLVDYQATGVFGKSLSDTGIYPFFRWVEGNFKSTSGLLMNAVRDERLAAAVGRKMMGKLIYKSPYVAYRVAVNTGKLTIGLSALSIMLHLWNWLMFPDREKKLPEDVQNNLHLIYGVGPDGKTRYLDRLGFFEDYLGWLGMDDAFTDFRKILDKEKSVAETWNRNWHRWVNKAYGGFSPLIKMLYEAPTGKSTYPDVFNPTGNNKWYEPIVAMFSLRKESQMFHELMDGLPKPKKYWENYLLGWVSLGSDPGEAAYYDVKSWVRDFKMKNNIPIGSSSSNDRRQALYHYKLALKYGDEKGMEKYENEYYDLGGMYAGLQASLDSLDPLYGMSFENRNKFEGSLSKRQKAIYERAQAYTEETLLGQGANAVK